MDILLFIFYISITFALVLFACEVKVSKTIIFIYSILFSLLVSTRSLDVPDTLAYYKYYMDIPMRFDYLLSMESGFGVGYTLINYLTKLFFIGEYRAVFFIIAFINYWSTYFGLKLIFKKENNLILFCLIMFISFFGLYYSAMVLRQGLVFSILIVSLGLLINKKIIASLLLGFISVFFHSSGFLVLLILAIYKILPIFKKQTYLIILILLGFIYYSRVSLLLNSEEIIRLISRIPFFDYSRYYYLIDYNQLNSNWYLYLLLSGISIAFFIEDKNKLIKRIFNLFIIGLLLMTIFRGISILERVTDYFVLFSFMLYGFIIYKTKNIGLRLLIFTVIFSINIYVVMNVIGI